MFQSKSSNEVKNYFFKAILNSLFGFLQKIGKSLMLPVSVLPVAGILLGVGGALLLGVQQGRLHVESHF
jgi:hypothetical protein